MTLLVRDEDDILDEQLSFHLAAGVDHFVVTDHGSRDRTAVILDAYARRGVLHLLRETGEVKRQSEWVTRMARMAAVELGADWVVNSDADEFWWPRGGDLKHVLADIPPRFGVVQTFVQPFVPRPGNGYFAERLTVRLTPVAPLNSPFGSFRAATRLLHRGVDDAVVGFGNSTVRGRGLVPLRGWAPVDVLHFPIRSFPQFERKFLAKHASAGGRQRHDTLRLVEAARVGRLRVLYEELCVSDDELREGLAERALALDTRLRDALRALGRDRESLDFPRSASGETNHAIERSVHDEGELVRLQRRLDEVASRMLRMTAGAGDRGS